MDEKLVLKVFTFALETTVQGLGLYNNFVYTAETYCKRLTIKGLDTCYSAYMGQTQNSSALQPPKWYHSAAIHCPC